MPQIISCLFCGTPINKDTRWISSLHYRCHSCSDQFNVEVDNLIELIEPFPITQAKISLTINDTLFTIDLIIKNNETIIKKYSHTAKINDNITMIYTPNSYEIITTLIGFPINPINAHYYINRLINLLVYL